MRESFLISEFSFSVSFRALMWRWGDVMLHNSMLGNLPRTEPPPVRLFMQSSFAASSSAWIGISGNEIRIPDWCAALMVRYPETLTERESLPIQNIKWECSWTRFKWICGAKFRKQLPALMDIKSLHWALFEDCRPWIGVNLGEDWCFHLPSDKCNTSV